MSRYRCTSTQCDRLGLSDYVMLLYGFRACDSVCSAMRWLDEASVAYTFVVFRRQPLT